jgi:aldose 1-epimerase
MAAARPLSGARVDLEHGPYRASLASLGASLRVLQHGARPLVVPYGLEELRPAFRGATLAPWPNRVIDGRYTFGGVAEQLPLTEPARGHALHGLALWLDYAVAERCADEAVLTATIEPQTGYPHRIELTVRYRLDDDGLHQWVTGRNAGETPAPFGTGPHPYLVAPGRLDEWSLALPAAQVLTVTADRLVPAGLAGVAEAEGGAFDFRAGRPIGATQIDHAFTALERDADGLAEVRVTAADGTGTAIRFDRRCAWVQVHTADRPDPEENRLGLAVEPMTCPPDAYNSGTDLIVLGPGESATAGWSIAALSAR